MTPFFVDWILIPVAKVLIVFGIVAAAVAVLTWIERRFLGFFQSRLGPNRVGPIGILQPLADGVKLLLKEDLIPFKASKFLFVAAPVFSIVPAFAGAAIIAFSTPWETEKKTIPLVVADVNIGILFLLAISSLGVYGIILGGLSSGSKFPLFGSLRSASQMLSYEVPLTLSILSVILLAGSFKLSEIVTAQQNMHVYFIFPCIIGFVVYLISAIAETNRLPFDLPEAESELTAGFHTEYSGMRFAFFFLAEYANIILVSMIASALFLGGYDIPFLNDSLIGESHPNLLAILGLFSYAIKCAIFIYFYIWIRTTFPRYRYDHLLKIGWIILLPLSLLNLFIIAGIKLLAS